MDADELRDRLARLRDLQGHTGPHRARLEAKLRQQAARLSPGDDPAGMAPAALVGGLIFGDLDAAREVQFQDALADLAAERWATADLVMRALVLELGGVA